MFKLDDAIVARLRERLEAVRGLVFAALFGSIVKRRIGHDIDIATAFDSGSRDRYEVLLGIAHIVADVFNAEPEAVDVIDLERASIDLKKKVLEEGMVLIDRGYLARLVKEVEKLYPEYHEYARLSIEEWLRSRDPAEIDVDVVKRRLDFVRSEVEFLEAHILSKGLEEVSSSPILRRLLERSFQLIIEAMIDTCRHITSAKVWRPAYTSRDFLLRCGEHGVIERSLAEAIASMVVLRNIIIHRYLEIDYAKLYVETKKLVDVAKTFERQVVDYLRREEQRKQAYNERKK